LEIWSKAFSIWSKAFSMFGEIIAAHDFWHCAGGPHVVGDCLANLVAGLFDIRRNGKDVPGVVQGYLLA